MLIRGPGDMIGAKRLNGYSTVDEARLWRGSIEYLQWDSKEHINRPLSPGLRSCAREEEKCRRRHDTCRQETGVGTAPDERIRNKLPGHYESSYLIN